MNHADFTQIDWDKVKEGAGMKTSKYARDRWAILRAKITAVDGEGNATSTPKKKASPAKRKAAGQSSLSQRPAVCSIRLC